MSESIISGAPIPFYDVVDLPNPTITINNSSGLITASYTQQKGIVSGGNISSTLQLTTKSAQTYTPTTENQTISANKWLTGTQTIKGDSHLIAENIKSGTTIFGITGTFQGFLTGNAVIHIYAEDNSTITIKKNSTTVATLAPNVGIINDTNTAYKDWYYPVKSVDYASYTVIATKNSKTASKTISIVNDRIYDCRLIYQLDLFISGTGFVNGTTMTVYGYDASANVNSSVTRISVSGYNRGFILSKPAINLSLYSSLKMRLTSSSAGGNNEYVIAIKNNSSASFSSGSTENLVQQTYNETLTNPTIKSINISTLTTTGYIVMWRGYGNCTIYDIWLEQ